MAPYQPDLEYGAKKDRDSSLSLSSSSGREEHGKYSQESRSTLAKFPLGQLPSTQIDSRHGFHTKGWNPASEGREMWDLVVVACAMITATFSIFTFSFFGFITPKDFPVYFAIERLLDLVFIGELFRNCWSILKLARRTTSDDQFRRKNTFHRNIGIIWWLLVDILSAIPWDLIALTLDDNNPSQRPLQVVRFLRMLHLFKLVRIMKMLRLKGTKFRYLEVNLGLKLAHYQLIRLIMSILLLSHICGCLFYFFGTVSRPETSWIQGLLTDGDLPDNTYGKYIASLYFSVYTITTIGYGDITPESSTERTYTTIIMLLGAAFFAFAISQGHDISSKLLERNEEDSREMDAWTDLLYRYAVDSELKMDIQRHMEMTFLQKSLDYEYDLVDKLPDDLKHRIQIEMHLDVINKAQAFKCLGLEDLEKICTSGIKEMIVGNQSKIQNKDEPVESIFLVVEGSFTLGEKEYGSFDIVGIEDAVTQSIAITDWVPESPDSLTNVSVLKIPWKAVNEAFEGSDNDTLQRWRDERAKVMWKKTIAEVKAKIKIHKGAQELRSTILGEVPDAVPPRLGSDKSASSDFSNILMDADAEKMMKQLEEKEREIQDLKAKLDNMRLGCE